MKFQQLQPFIQHFTASFPEHLSAAYFIICSNEQERKKILTDLATYFNADWDYKKATSIKEAIDHLQSFSLISKNLAAICDQSEQIYQHEHKYIAQFIEHPPTNALLLLGLASDKQITDLYKKGKKEIVILDLSQEKPWEKKERMKQEIMQRITQERKKISPQALEAFFERLPLDRPILLQELEKILCFTLDHSTIEKEDVEKICSASLEMSHFQIAEQIVWNKLDTIPNIEDLSQMLFLIGQLRHHLEMGLAICSLLKEKNAKETISAAFPQLFPKTLEKYLRVAPVKKESFFLNGLNHLFALELGVKTSLGPPEILFASFCASISEDK